MKMRAINKNKPDGRSTLRRLRELHPGLGYIHFGAWSPSIKPYSPRVYAGKKGETR